tara:strand:- start:78 stop:833 length:756 start_codon:yes stop_codon:yes gene_type:complete
MEKAIIWRIIGNDMPPRDAPGSRLHALEYILLNEPTLKQAKKLWLLNRILDDDYRKQVAELLARYSQPYIAVPFDKSLEPTVDVMRGEGININAARNLSVKLGHALAAWSVVLDGDCFFETEEDWNVVLEEMEKDSFKYLSVPSQRMGGSALGEPMLAFHRESDLRFNETLKFGKSEKLELLFRLGHDDTPNSGHLKISGNATKVLGKVVHFSTGTSDVERFIVPRINARNESIRQLAARLTAIQKQEAIG